MAATPNAILPDSLFTIRATLVYRKQICEERRGEEREGKGGEERGEERRGARGASWRQLPTQLHLRVCTIKATSVYRKPVCEGEKRRGRRVEGGEGQGEGQAPRIPLYLTA